jgi:hypothetical protein
MFLFFLLASPILAASAYFLFFNDTAKTINEAPRRTQASPQTKLTRNGFTNTVDELNYQLHLKKINAERIDFATKEQKKLDEIDKEKGRAALTELGKLAKKDNDKKQELALVIDSQKPANDALEFIMELEKPQQNDEPEVETEIANTLGESIIGDVLSSSLGIPLPVFEAASTTNDAVSAAPKPTNSMPAKRKRKGMGIA